MIGSERERDFYDRQYARFLALPDHALRLDRQVLEGNIDNPSHPFYERRWLYRAAIRALESEPLPGRRVLDYGCGPADFGIWMATEGARVTLLDLSPAAIEVALKRARKPRGWRSAGLPRTPAVSTCWAAGSSIWYSRAPPCTTP